MEGADQARDGQDGHRSPSKRKAAAQLPKSVVKRRKLADAARAAQHAQRRENLWPVLVRGAAQLVAALKAQGCLLSSLIAVCSVLHHHLCWHLREGMCCKAQQTGFDVHACSSLTNNRKRLRLQECTGQQRTPLARTGNCWVELAQQFWRLLQEPLLRPQKAPNLPPQQQQRQRRERQAPSWMLSTVRCRIEWTPCGACCGLARMRAGMYLTVPPMKVIASALPQ